MILQEVEGRLQPDKGQDIQNMQMICKLHKGSDMVLTNDMHQQKLLPAAERKQLLGITDTLRTRCYRQTLHYLQHSYLTYVTSLRQRPLGLQR